MISSDLIGWSALFVWMGAHEAGGGGDGFLVDVRKSFEDIDLVTLRPRTVCLAWCGWNSYVTNLKVYRQGQK